jgi:hypothetical protein
MHMHLLLAQRETARCALPSVCPKPGCGGTEFRLHQQVIKPLRDAQRQTVTVYRYQCVRCCRTFRVYPQGVSHAHTSRQVHELGVLLYFLGLSFGAVSTALDGLGVYLSKSRVHDAVQAFKHEKPDLRRCDVFEAIQARHLQRGTVDVRCLQHWLPLSLLADDRCGLVLAVSSLCRAKITILEAHIEPLIGNLNGQLLLANTCSTRDTHN